MTTPTITPSDIAALLSRLQEVVRPAPLLVTIDIAAKHLGVGRDVLYRNWPALVASRGLETVRVGPRGPRIVTKSLAACVRRLVADGWPETGTKTRKAVRT